MWSVSTLPDDVLETIFVCLPAADVFSLMMCCRSFAGAFRRLDRSLDRIRLSYLNNESADMNRFGRLRDVFTCGTQWEVQDKAGFETRLIQRAHGVGGVVLRKLFDFNRTTAGSVQFIVAGGAVIGTLHERFQDFGDIDIFVAGNGASMQECHETLRGVLHEVGVELATDGPASELEGAAYAITKNGSTMSIVSPSTDTDRPKPLQFIFRRVACMEELLCFFDLDCCRFGYDGHTVATISEGLRSLALWQNYCGEEHIDNRLYYNRAMKYYRRTEAARRTAGIETAFVSVHPLDFLLTHGEFKEAMQLKMEMIGHGNENAYSTATSSSVLNGNEDGPEDANLYAAFVDLPFEDVRQIALFGLDAYNTGQHGRTYGEPLSLHKHSAGLYFTLSFAELYVLDQSCFFREGYFESHLYGKYSIVACYMTGAYFNCRKDRPGVQRRYDGAGYSVPPAGPSQDKQFSALGRILNDAPKRLVADLSGKVAVVTGGRTKIGFETALLLLRFGATVVVTTRFTADANERFAREVDYEAFRGRLVTYPLNLKVSEDVHAFTSYMRAKYPRMHILVNNAAQTVRRPVRYYKHLLRKEYASMLGNARADTGDSGVGALPDKKRPRLFVENEMLSQFVGGDCSARLHALLPVGVEVKEMLAIPEHTPQRRCVRSMFTNLHPDDLDWKEADFPNHETDAFGEQVDERTHHSWHLRPDEVHPLEMFEAQMVNHLSPVQLLTGLAPLLEMTRVDAARGTAPSHVINVTSIEGQFSVPQKEPQHMHTNMSKAALNMLTRTTAEFYARKGILVNSVDTGWVSSAIPTWKVPPLTITDAAFRILNPILSQGLAYGKLYKNYEVVDW